MRSSVKWALTSGTRPRRLHLIRFMPGGRRRLIRLAVRRHTIKLVCFLFYFFHLHKPTVRMYAINYKFKTFKSMKVNLLQKIAAIATLNLEFVGLDFAKS